MPVMNGLMLAKEIRRSPSICGIPLMMLTSDRDRDEAALARQLDIRIFLVKPVRQANLFKAVCEMFGASAREQPRSAGADWQKLDARILVVEDNPTNQKVIVLLLKKFGCSADVASNGVEAIRAAGLAKFDAILMDCQMPVMDGFEATAEIRRNSKAHVPIVALTANAMDGERERCIEAGMDDYLSKPVRAEELLKKLQYWIIPKMDAAEAGAATAVGMRQDLERFISGLADEGVERADAMPLLNSFLETSARFMDDIREAAALRDAARLERAAHSMKGTFATFGFSTLAGHAASLETAGYNQQWGGVEENVRQALSGCSEACKAVEEALPVAGRKIT
jgi:CheY-like chemotaxis protein